MDTIFLRFGGALAIAGLAGLVIFAAKAIGLWGVAALLLALAGWAVMMVSATSGA